MPLPKLSFWLAIDLLCDSDRLLNLSELIVLICKIRGDDIRHVRGPEDMLFPFGAKLECLQNIQQAHNLMGGKKIISATRKRGLLEEPFIHSHSKQTSR